MHVVLASLLNPPLHTRLFYKQAQTLQQAGYSVTVIGMNNVQEKADFFEKDIHCIALPYLKRTNFLARYKRRQEIEALVLSLNPDAVHIHTPELLPVCPAFKNRNLKIVYDVHENYRKNIQTATYYPFYLKPLVLRYLAYCENFVKQYTDAVVYAENTYRNYLNINTEKVFYVLNAYQSVEPAKDYLLSFNPDEYKLILLYTGTIAKEWGILNAIQTWERLQKRYKTALVIAGSGMFKEIPVHKDIYVYPAENYLPYPHIVRILEEMSKVNQKVFGLMLYEPLPNITECLPTKWFEFVHYRIPILYTNSEYWNTLNTLLNFGIPHTEVDTITLPLQYYSLRDKRYQEYTWQKQAENLLKLYQNL